MSDNNIIYGISKTTVIAILALAVLVICTILLVTETITFEQAGIFLGFSSTFLIALGFKLSQDADTPKEPGKTIIQQPNIENPRIEENEGSNK